MASKNTNPFVLPGLGQSGEQAQNPVLAGMEMMRQAWQGLVNAGGLEQTAMMTPLTVEELDRRITDLRTVENWLRLNLSMLTSSIQGLEVQRATITTLRSFVETTMGVGHSGAAASSLDAVLGVGKSRASAKDTSARAPRAGSALEKHTPAKGGEAGGAAAPPAESSAGGTAAMPSSAQAWWNMLQSQFDTLAAATAATMRGAEAVRAASQAGSTAASKPRGKDSAVKSPSAASPPAAGGPVPAETDETRKVSANGRRGAAKTGKVRAAGAGHAPRRGGSGGGEPNGQ